MNEEIKHINNLLERFFEGQTSNQEERELYRFFTQDDIPEALACFKPVINYFETGLADELEPNPINSQFSTLNSHLSPPPQNRKKRWLFWSGIAASFLLLLFSSLFFLQINNDPYEGSYIIRNGVRITDLSLIRAELIATEQNVIAQLESTGQRSETQIMHTMEEHNQRFLENFQDEDIRREVEEIINLNF